jgi:hypothetical protein
MAKGQMRSTKEKKKPKQDKPKKAGPSYSSQTTEVFRKAENKGPTGGGPKK